MSRRLFDFRCENKHNTERFVDETVTVVECCECGDTARKVITGCGIYLEPFSGDHPSSYDRWNRVRAEKLAQEKKRNS